MLKDTILCFSGITSDSLYFEMVQELNKSNKIEKILFYGEESEDFCQALKRDGFSVEAVSIVSLPKAFIITLRSFSKSKKIQVLCNGQIASIIGITASKILKFEKRLYIRHWNRPHWNPKNKKMLKAFSADLIINTFSTQIISVSHLVNETLIKERVRSSKIRLIENGIDLNGLAQLRIQRNRDQVKKKKYVIGYIGRIDSSKGLNFLVESFEVLQKSNSELKLLIAGPKGDFYESLLSLIKKLKINEVELRPHRVDNLEFYKSIDILVHVPISLEAESFGLVFLEGIAAGLSCVFTRSGVLTSLQIDKEQNQVRLVPFKDAEAITAAIGECLEILKSRDVVLNSTDIVSEFSKEKMYHDYKRVLN